jgi:polysaccharide deacetylase 2 family uncharacterized protein YibQ
MKRSAAKPVVSRRKRWGWGTLIAGAFLGGLLVVGAVLFWPAGGEAPPAGPSSFGSSLPARNGSPADNAASGAPDGRRAPRIAIVVDDLGYDPVRDAEWLGFPEKITASVLPFGPSSKTFAASARSRGFTVLLHVPMEPEEAAEDGTGPYRLRRGMTGGEMEEAFSRMAKDVPQATGASNHMGSAFTSDPAAMDAFALILKGKGYFFVDSLTAAGSVGAAAARRAGVQALRRDVFLDVDPRPEEMRRQWEKAIALAKERGEAVLICHSRKETLSALLEMLPVLRREGVRAVTVEELLAGMPKG